MAFAAAMQDADIFVKTDAGRDEIKSRALGLPMSIRAILLMIDGQRNVAAMRAIIAGSKAPADVLESLAAQGLIEPLVSLTAPTISPAAEPRPSPAAAPAPVASAPAETMQPARPARIGDPPVRVAREPVTPSIAEPPAAKIPPMSTSRYDGPLDLTLPTIAGGPPTVEPEPPPPASPPTAEPVAAAPANRYEHLYQMMNEIVRDFLSPTRRYFFQLKIERCATSEELLELLGDLQAALAKARGEPFASDVIARLRNAA